MKTILSIFKPIWRTIIKSLPSGGLSLIILMEIIVIAFIWIGYQLPIWSGFEGKVWWDWVQLIIVPLVLGGGGVLINSTVQETEKKRSEQQAEIERKRAEDALMNNIFENYLDDMADLLIEKDLQQELNKNDEENPSPVVIVARARTVTALRSLDKERRALCLNFLREAKLITGEKGRLFVKVQFGDIDLRDSILVDANLSDANLESANLRGADLSRSDLRWGLLSQANLEGASLTNANLKSAVLTECNLKGAIGLTDQQLARAILLQDATMPDGSTYDKRWKERLLPYKPRTRFVDALENDGDLTALDLRFADLSRLDLEGQDLSGLDLSDAFLGEAILNGANLSEANLRATELTESSLNGANLTGANLTNAFLGETDLTEANLSQANLTGAVNLTDEQLITTESLEGATMPDGTPYDESWESKLALLREEIAAEENAANQEE